MSEPAPAANVYALDPSSDWRFFARLPDGRALVSCHARNAVLIVDGEGSEIGRLAFEFGKPEGIAVHPGDGRVLVVDRHHHCIRVFDSCLNPMRSIATDHQPPRQLNQPVGIAISPSGNSVWVADNENHRVLQLDADGKYVSTLGSGCIGTAPGCMFCPCGVAVFDHPAHGELVIVSEWGNGRVQVFRASSGGEVFAMYGGVPHAHHVTVDSHANIYVSEYATRKIKIFNLNGAEYRCAGELPSAVSLVAAAADLDTIVTQNRLVRVPSRYHSKKRVKRGLTADEKEQAL